jgi:GT2 family glycosyltransferase
VFALTHSPINPPREGACSLLSGAAMLVRREAFNRLGGFDPNIFLFWEDNDLCRRVIDSGGQVLFVSESEMRHVRGGSSARAPGAIYTSRWHQAWSRFYVFAKHEVASDQEAWVKRFASKTRLARLMRAKERIERYQGSLDGALAFLRGESALAHEGLQ